MLIIEERSTKMETEPDQSQRSRLLGLPTEIRLKIYESLRAAIPYHRKVILIDRDLRGHPPVRRLLSITQVCRQIRAESLTEFYSEMKFWLLFRLGRADQQLDHAKAWLETVDEIALASMNEFEINNEILHGKQYKVSASMSGPQKAIYINVNLRNRDKHVFSWLTDSGDWEGGEPSDEYLQRLREIVGSLERTEGKRRMSKEMLGKILDMF